jgi:type VI secretion system protein ImpB
MSNTQHKLDRIRPPRVQITYDVETGGAIEKKELPLVVGIMSDLSGHREEALPKLKERKFTNIDRDNYNDVLKSISPKLKLTVDNKVNKDGGRLAADLKFQHLDDFHPVNVAKQIEPLQKLLAARQRLVDFVAKLDGNDALADELRAATSPESIDKLRSEALKN